MASVNRRLDDLEARAGLRSDPPDEEGERHAWLARAACRRVHELYHRQEANARGVIRLLTMQGRLGATTEEVREQLLRWRPEIERGAIERALARVIYDQEPGTENMVCPPEWRASFVAADELLRRVLAVSDAELAASFVRLRGAAEAGDVAAETNEAERLGISDALCRAALGPDAGAITVEECDRRLAAAIADFLYGERGYAVSRHMERLEKGES